MDTKLTKVRMEFDDGSYQTMVGEAADRWLKTLNGYLQISTLHGSQDMAEFEEHWDRKGPGSLSTSGEVPE